jgi:hypothetical protein
MKRTLLAPLLLLSACAPAPASPPKDEGLYWLEVCAAHGFTPVEAAMATGREAPDIARMQPRLHPPKKPADRFLVLPYPGGRHVRRSMLDHDVDLHRGSLCTVFLPSGGYVVLTVPDAVWCENELVYLAHTRESTRWDKRGVTLERIDWTRGEGNILTCRRVLPDGLEYSVRVAPAADGAWMEVRLRNGTDRTHSGLSAEVGALLKEATGFNRQTSQNKLKVPEAGVCAVGSEDGKRWIALAFENNPRLWDNAPSPSIHADPRFPDLAPGQEAVAYGRLFVYEGRDLEGEVYRRAASGTLLPR